MAPERSEASGWVAWLLFAAVLLVSLGAFQAVLGIAGILTGTVFTVAGHDAVLPVDATTLSWLQLAFAAAAVVIGLGLLLGRRWARIAAVILAFVNGLAGFVFIERYPWWATAFILFSIVTIWAIVVHGDEVAGVYADQ